MKPLLLISLALVLLLLTAGCLANELTTVKEQAEEKHNDYSCGQKTITYYNNTIGFTGFGHGEGSDTNWNKTYISCNETICKETIVPFGYLLDDGTLICNRDVYTSYFESKMKFTYWMKQNLTLVTGVIYNAGGS